MLLNIASKVLSHILFNHLFSYTEKIIGNYQCGYQPGRFTITQIFKLGRFWRKQKNIILVCIISLLTFELVMKLHAATKQFGFPGKLMRMVRLMMKNSACSRRVQLSISARFGTVNGLRQGEALACVLFNVALEEVIGASGIQSRGTIFYKAVQVLAYASDLGFDIQDSCGS